MFDRQVAIVMIQDSLDSLARSGTLKSQFSVEEDAVLMGSGTGGDLDSLGFVTLIMDIEERLEKEVDRDCPITLTDIAGFDVNNPVLTAKVLADHLVRLAGER